MVNIELRMLAQMLYSGNFTPIVQGDITAETFTTEQGLILFNFVTTYSSSTDGAARYPSLSIVRARFQDSAIELPDPDPADRLEALVYETKSQRLKADVQELALRLDQIAKSTDDPLEEVVAVTGRLKKLSEQGQRARHISLATGFQDVIADYDSGTILKNGIPWQWPSMHRATRGIHRKEFIVFAGRPKSRKTFTALSVACHAVMTSYARVLIFSPEMPRQQILLRCIAFICGLRYSEFKDAALDQAEMMRLVEAARAFGRMPEEDDDQYTFRLSNYFPDMPPGMVPTIDIVESAGKSLSWMESQIELYRPDIVVADSFYKQHYEGKRADADWKAVTATSRGLKEMAMTENVALIGTHQMNRESEKTVGTLANMALADAIGQDADLICRVVTGIIEGRQASAIVVLGGREVPFEGLIINNVPCCDYSEIAPIENRSTIEELMKKEDKAEAKAEADDIRKKKFGGNTQDALNERARQFDAADEPAIVTEGEEQ